MEFGLPFLGLGLDYADAYPFLGSFELPPNAPPSLRQDVSRKERLSFEGEHRHVDKYELPCDEVDKGEARCYDLTSR